MLRRKVGFMEKAHFMERQAGGKGTLHGKGFMDARFMNEGD